MELLELEFSREFHPVEVIEQVAHDNDWSFDGPRRRDFISVAGSWTDYHVSIFLDGGFRGAAPGLRFRLKVPEARALEVIRLL